MPLRAVPPPGPGPAGCDNIDGRIVEVLGLRIGGLGGSLRYKAGANQYSQGQMRRRALGLELRARLMPVRSGRRLDILVTHAPPFGLEGPPRSDNSLDSAHVGFVAFPRLIRKLHPLLAVHGHIHPFGRMLPERNLDATRVVNVVPSRVIDL